MKTLFRNQGELQLESQVYDWRLAQNWAYGDQ